MRILIVDDDFTSRVTLQKMLEHRGICHTAVNGREAVEAARLARQDGQPYDLICLDIKMPEMDGQAALKELRSMEWADGIVSSEGSKIVMTTVLDDMENICTAYAEVADGYLVKPVNPAKLLDLLKELQLVA
jgi:two-component system, chemotaxis family, chemotaxis protein CheY